jgi:hypothetical protein
MKQAILGLVLLVGISCVLLKTGGACNPPSQTWQTVGDMIVPDSTCGQSGTCRDEQVQIAWDDATHSVSWQYVAEACVPCPIDNVPAVCGD